MRSQNSLPGKPALRKKGCEQHVGPGEFANSGLTAGLI